MSRVKVSEEQIGPLVAGGPFWKISSYQWTDDVEPLSTEYEIPDSVQARFLPTWVQQKGDPPTPLEISPSDICRSELGSAGCWRSELECCWRFNAKTYAAVVEALLEALEGPVQDLVSEASSPVKRFALTPQRSRESLKRPIPDSPRPMDEDICPDEIYLGWGAKLCLLDDDRVSVSGAALHGTEPLLLNILRFEPAHPVYPCLSSSPVKHRPDADSPRAAVPAPAPQWVSAWPLTPDDRAFVEIVLRHRLPDAALGHEQLVAIPPEAGPVPSRFLPTDAAGRPLSGPYVTYATDDSLNCGRQFFSGTGDCEGEFLWADGTMPSCAVSEPRLGHAWASSELDYLTFEEEGSGDWDGWSCGGCAGDMELDRHRD